MNSLNLGAPCQPVDARESTRVMVSENGTGTRLPSLWRGAVVVVVVVYTLERGDFETLAVFCRFRIHGEEGG